MDKLNQVLIEKRDQLQKENPNISKKQMYSRLYSFMGLNNIGYTLENLNCLSEVCKCMKENHKIIYSINKNHHIKSKAYDKWFLLKQHIEDISIITDEVILEARTRKECIDYAEQNGIQVNYIDNGRIPHGCRW